MARTPWIAILLVVGACATPEDPLADYEQVNATTLFEAPYPTGVTTANREAVARGKYLVELLGCGACHTEGALVGRANMHRWLAGSSVGIAYTNPVAFSRPGVVFPPNITPDPDTGIGRWSREQIAAAIRVGAGRHGRGRILVMPWPAYARLTDEDVYAIVDYLRSIEPINSRVPENVPPGRATQHEYVHFGVYRRR
ncbi:MAG TPA: cytochrome c [Woeseiaceae bacterium]|nr:cytochrome c [Woeseiaceae bacterium]